MKYFGLPLFMWGLYKKSFKNSLTTVFNYDEKKAKQVTKNAKKDYKKILKHLPEFEKNDDFATNIVSCAMLIGFIKNMDNRPTVDELTAYYDLAMRTNLTEGFCEMKGKEKFSEKTIEGLKKSASSKFADRNPYSWNFDFRLYEDGSGYESKFFKCGICTLMREYGYFDLVPAMCHLDYTMSDMCKTTNFVRKYTLASGGPYCDCGYKKKEE